MTNKKTKDTSDSSHTLKYTAIGVSLAGLAAGAYFYFGPNGEKNQKHTKAWVVKMKGDILEKLEEAHEVTEPIYHAIIDAVAANYQKKIKNGDEDLTEIVDDLKKQWKHLNKAMTSKTKSSTKKPAKKKTAKKKTTAKKS